MEEATYVLSPIFAVETECGPRTGAGATSASVGFLGSLMDTSSVAGAMGSCDSGPASRSSPVHASRHLGWTVTVPAATAPGKAPVTPGTFGGNGGSEPMTTYWPSGVMSTS